MSKAHRRQASHPFDEAILAAKRDKGVPHEFVLDEIARLAPVTRPMFGCLAVYVQDKIVLILRDKQKSRADNGVWLATAVEHHESLRREFPRMRSIHVFGQAPTQWQVLPADDPDFEAAAIRACQLILACDPRIGRIPVRRRSASRTGAYARSAKPFGGGRRGLPRQVGVRGRKMLTAGPQVERQGEASMKMTVRDDSARQRYELEVEGGVAFVDYLRDGRKVIMTHAEVPLPLRGGGIGAALVKGALALVRERGEKVVPLCPFVVQYMRRHPETHDLLAERHVFD
ncbi:MAG TPA: GNAT family N-acetyltransferase [Steroidobacteraceae bacterium]|jgi:predicted GNAT family acetyltransferase